MGGRSYKYSKILNFPLHWNNGGNVEGDLHNRLALAIEEIIAPLGRTWKSPVATVGDLPVVLNTPGDVRVTLDTFQIWVWNGSSWELGSSGALVYRGVWDATNPPAGGSPTLADGVGLKGDYYVVGAAGVQDLGSGPIDFNPADWAVYNGTIWEKADHTDVVTSVFGRQGVVVAVSGDYTHAQIGSIGIDDHHARDHAATHEDGGADEISVGGLSGLLADAQNPTAHATSHKPGGSDEVATGTPTVDSIPKSGGILPTIHPDWIQDATTGSKGKVELAVDGEVAANVVVQGNDARLSDARTPLAHATTHEGGSDPMTPGGIGAEPAFTKNTAFNKNFGVNSNDVPEIDSTLAVSSIVETEAAGKIITATKAGAYNKAFGTGAGDVCEGNDARLSDARTPTAHKDTHKVGGGDAFTSADLVDAVVRRLRETGGPTDLLVGAVPIDSFLARVGTSIVGIPRTVLRSWSVTPGDNTGAGASAGSTTPSEVRYKLFPGTTTFGTPVQLQILAESSSGNTGFVDVYNLDTGQILMVVTGIVSTATGGAIYTSTTIVNPFPTGQARLAVRIYRGVGAATISLYDLHLT